MFSNYAGYIFHDSRGFEAGSEEELRIVQAFIQKRTGQARPQDRLHAIWFALSNLDFCDDAADGHISQVLRPNGQLTSRAGSEISQGHLL